MNGTGLYLYDWQSEGQEQWLAIVQLLFGGLEPRMKRASYFWKSEPDERGETVQRTSMTWKKFLEGGIDNAYEGCYVQARSNALDADMYLGLSNGAISDQRSTFNLQIEAPFDRIHRHLESRLAELLEVTKPSYGFMHGGRDIMRGNGYVIGVAPSTVLDNESVLLFQQEYHAVEPAVPDYLGKRLRMVYEENILTDAHLRMPVGDQTLREFVESSPQNGALTPVSGYTLWTTEASELPRLNRELGEAGALISWQEPKKPRPLPIPTPTVR